MVDHAHTSPLNRPATRTAGPAFAGARLITLPQRKRVLSDLLETTDKLKVQQRDITVIDIPLCISRYLYLIGRCMSADRLAS